jgi:hypothetical protein
LRHEDLLSHSETLRFDVTTRPVLWKKQCPQSVSAIRNRAVEDQPLKAFRMSRVDQYPVGRWFGPKRVARFDPERHSRQTAEAIRNAALKAANR